MMMVIKGFSHNNCLSTVTYTTNRKTMHQKKTYSNIKKIANTNIHKKQTQHTKRTNAKIYNKQNEQQHTKIANSNRHDKQEK